MAYNPGRWWIAVPVWGERCLNVFEQYSWPALRNALSFLDTSWTLVAHSDAEGCERIHAAVNEAGRVRTFGLPPAAPTGNPNESFGILSNAHRKVMDLAQPGDAVVLLTADLILSINSLFNCDNHFRSGKQAVACMGMRVNEREGMEIPTHNGAKLLDWGWLNRHRMTEECTWPNGNSVDVWRQYFQDGNEVACRLFLPHPLAFIKGSRAPRFAPTIDVNLLDAFPLDKIHLARQPSDVAMIELSPPDKEFDETATMRQRFEDTSIHGIPVYVKHTIHRHVHYFKHKIVVRGKGDVDDQEVYDRIVHGR